MRKKTLGEPIKKKKYLRKKRKTKKKLCWNMLYPNIQY